MFKQFAAVSLALALSPMAVLADSHTSAPITIDGVLPYASVGQSVFIAEGEDGAPEEISVGLVVHVVDEDDPTIAFTGEVSGPVVGDDGAPNGRWRVLLTEEG